jgi:Sulfotransferase domain
MRNRETILASAQVSSMAPASPAKAVFASEKPTKWVMRGRAVRRAILWRFFSRRLPLYLITEFPKSGGTWLANMLSECLQVPFPDPQAPPQFKSMILRDTKLYSPHYHNIVVVFRDGRDVMISAYYHFLFHNELNLPYGVERRRKTLGFKDFHDIRANLPRFIEYMFTEFPIGGWTTRFNWSQFVESWIDKPVTSVRYEDMLQHTVATLARVLRDLTAQEFCTERLSQVDKQYSFHHLTGRQPGQEKKNTFIRKGIAGDWKNNFSPEARQVFAEFGGPQLIKLGYEPNDHWIRETTSI